jgi:hypothetical protein
MEGLVVSISKRYRSESVCTPTETKRRRGKKQRRSSQQGREKEWSQISGLVASSSQRVRSSVVKILNQPATSSSTMVSWLRAFDLKWKNYNSQFGAGEAFAFQNRLIAVRDEPDPVDSMAKMLSEASEYPGIFLIASGTQGRNGSVKPNYRVAPFHHPKVVLAEGDPRAIGLASLHVTAPMAEVEIAQLTGRLVSEKKAKSKTWREKLVPSLEKLVEENHPIDDPTSREDGIGGFAIQDLKDWPKIIFVPVHLVKLLFAKGEASDDESKTGEDIDGGDAYHLLSKLVNQLQSVMESNREEYEEALAVGLHLAAFLWAVANKLNEGVEVLSVEGDRISVEHSIACNRELLYDEENWKVLKRGKQRENDWDSPEDDESEKEVEESNQGHGERTGMWTPGARVAPAETSRATLPVTQTAAAPPPRIGRQRSSNKWQRQARPGQT